MTTGALREVEAALEHHELIKVRLSGDRHERADWSADIASQTRSAVVGAVGRIVILYRRAKDPERRRFE